MSESFHTDESLPGVEPGAELSVSEEKLERGLKYVSKSRVKTYKQCPFKFYLKYWCECRPPTNYYMSRGSEVHEVFEHFHQNLKEYIEEHGERPFLFTPLLDEKDSTQWVELVGEFMRFEEERWREAKQQDVAEFSRTDDPLDLWEPLGVEVEGWLGEVPEDYERADPDMVSLDGPPVGDIPWMGKADAILHSASVPGVKGDGVVILDYKTGSVPDEQYRDEGIFLEGEFYGRIFEEFYDVDAVAGYYPSENELIVSPYPNSDRLFDVKRAALGMQERPEVGEDRVPENFQTEEQPLCHYGHGKCYFYDVCPSEWGK